MNSSPDAHVQQIRHAGPQLAVVSSVFVLLFLAGLYPVTMFGGLPYFPGPWESQDTIAAFFQARPTAVLIGAALHFGAAIPLGIFTATVVSRLHFLGVRATGATIALFGGFAASFFLALSGLVQWVLARPEVAGNAALLRALQDLAFMAGGPGHVVPLGLLLAGVSVTTLFTRL